MILLLNLLFISPLNWCPHYLFYILFWSHMNSLIILAPTVTTKGTGKLSMLYLVIIINLLCFYSYIIRNLDLISIIQLFKTIFFHWPIMIKTNICGYFILSFTCQLDSNIYLEHQIKEWDKGRTRWRNLNTYITRFIFRLFNRILGTYNGDSGNYWITIISCYKASCLEYIFVHHSKVSNSTS